jgi:ATP-binding cassette subfamily F protein uup
VVISHDRAFLDRTVDDVVVVDEHGWSGRYAGGYAAWDADRRSRSDRNRRQGKAASVSHDAGADRSPARASAPAPAGGAGAGGAGAGGNGRPQRSISTIRHELKATDRLVRQLSSRVTTLEQHLAAITDDHEALRESGAELHATMAELAAAEERWLELAEEAEQRAADRHRNS